MRSIIFADNDQDFLETRTEFLTQANYHVIKAASYTKAENLLRNTWAPLAVLDIRLIDDDDEKDLSGLSLAESYRAITKIILTNFPETEIVRRFLRLQSDGRPLVIDLLHKEEEPAVFIEAVNRAFTEQVGINWSLVIDWKARDLFSLVALIDPSSQGKLFLNRTEEFEHLFRRLFYEKDLIRIDRLLWQRDARLALVVLAFKDNKLSGSYLVVCGKYEPINGETVSFSNMAPHAPGETNTVLITHTETTHFAARTYKLAGMDFESMLSLLQVYRTVSDQIFNTCLNTLFKKTLASWHQNQFNPQDDKPLAQLYRQGLRLTERGISTTEFSSRIKAILSQLVTMGHIIRQKDNKLAFQYWAKEYIYPDPTPLMFQDLDTGQPVVMLKSPGYLSGDNILTMPDGRTWLTDFSDAGYYPLLWNYIFLESEIRFDWIETRELQQHFAIECALVTGDFYKPNLSDVDATLRKPLRAIQTIRKLAYRDLGKGYKDYHLGIFFCAAKRIADYNPDAPLLPGELARLAHALIAMAMIGDILSKDSEQISNATQGTPGITMDKANRQVWVEGQPVELSSQDFDLLLYLYEHPNQLCRREEVFKHVYGREYSASEDYLLYTAISRLREKIEPDKERPQYLITKRGVGYFLKLPTEG